MDKDITQKYRNVFTSKEGCFVLAHMLSELGFFDDIEDLSPMRRYAARLLKIIGGGDVQRNAFDAFIKGLAGQRLDEAKAVETLDDMLE